MATFNARYAVLYDKLDEGARRDQELASLLKQNIDAVHELRVYVAGEYLKPDGRDKSIDGRLSRIERAIKAVWWVLYVIGGILGAGAAAVLKGLVYKWFGVDGGHK